MSVKILPSLQQRQHDQPGSSNPNRIRGRKLQTLRLRIFRQWEYRCAECKRMRTDDQLVLDHRIPLSQGGTDSEANLQPLCKDTCHVEKTQREQPRMNAGGLQKK